eukprot:4949792-Alexandrium_andersonii.AAC.1
MTAHGRSRRGPRAASAGASQDSPGTRSGEALERFLSAGLPARSPRSRTSGLMIRAARLNCLLYTSDAADDM